MTKRENTIGSQTLEKLRKEILSGKYKEGTFLPSERELGEIHNVSKSTMHNVLARLHKEGLVCINPGRGIFVKNIKSEKTRLKRFFFRTSEYGWFNGSRTSGQILKGICSGAQKTNSELLMSFSDSSLLTDQIINEYSSGNIQGIVYGECSRLYDSLILPLEKAGVPYAIGNLENDYPVVAVQLDHRDIARQAVKHLLHLGHQKIGFINCDTNSSTNYFIYREFLAGFRGALAEENIQCDEKFILETKYATAAERDESEEKLLDFFSRKEVPTAIFAARNYIAEYCFRACRKLGLKIPGDISVISFDDLTWDMAEHEGLTTFREPASEMGEKAVELLNQWVDTGIRPDKIIMKCELIERCSTSVPNKQH